MHLNNNFANCLVINNPKSTIRILISTWLMTSLIISMILKNEILASLLATRDNNIDSIHELINTKINAIVDGNSYFYKTFKEECVGKPIRIEPVEYKEIYSEKTLFNILKGTHALIYVQHRLNHIYMINYKYPLHLSKSKSGTYLLLRGFIMKKSIDKEIENKIKKA